MPGGRPTKYNESWIPKLEKAMRNGDTIEIFCYDNNIADSTFRLWRKQHKEFSLAFERCKKYSEAYHQKYLRTQFENKNFQSAAFKLFMANCFGWSDKKVVQQNTDLNLDLQQQLKRTIRDAIDE